MEIQMSGKIKVRRGLLRSLGRIETFRRTHGDHSVPFYEALKKAVLDNVISGSSVVGSGFKRPKRAAIKWLDVEITATKEGRRHPLE
tara:strand:+ start:299 stop:559 length:261 start_codon:yes stop_codon:yes gene_type:complete